MIHEIQFFIGLWFTQVAENTLLKFGKVRLFTPLPVSTCPHGGVSSGDEGDRPRGHRLADYCQSTGSRLRVMRLSPWLSNKREIEIWKFQFEIYTLCRSRTAQLTSCSTKEWKTVLTLLKRGWSQESNTYQTAILWPSGQQLWVHHGPCTKVFVSLLDWWTPQLDAWMRHELGSEMLTISWWCALLVTAFWRSCRACVKCIGCMVSVEVHVDPKDPQAMMVLKENHPAL